MHILLLFHIYTKPHLHRVSPYDAHLQGSFPIFKLQAEFNFQIGPEVLQRLLSPKVPVATTRCLDLSIVSTVPALTIT